MNIHRKNGIESSEKDNFTDNKYYNGKLNNIVNMLLMEYHIKIYISSYFILYKY